MLFAFHVHLFVFFLCNVLFHTRDPVTPLARALLMILLFVSCHTVPSAAPEDVAVDVLNNTLIKVTWARVSQDKLNGYLGGYRVIIPP